MQDHSTLLSHPASQMGLKRLGVFGPTLGLSCAIPWSTRSAPERQDETSAAIGDLHPVAAGLIERKNFCWKARRCGPVFDEDTVL